MDIRNTILSLAIGNFIFAVVLALFQRRAAPTHRLPFFGLAKVLQGLGCLILFWKEQVPDMVSVAGANVLLLSGCAYECWAMCHLSQRPVSRCLQAVSILLIALASGAIYFLPTSRFVISSAIIAGCYAVGGWATLTAQTEKSLLRSSLGSSLLVLATLMAIRAGWALMATEVPSPYADSLVQQLTFGVLYVTMFSNGFGVLMLAKELSDRKVQAALAEELAIMQTLPTGLCFLRQRTIVRCNAAMEAMFQVAPGGLLNRSARCLYPNEKQFTEAGRLIYDRIRQTGRFEGEMEAIRADGQRMWCWVQASTIASPSSTADTVLSITDITERKRDHEMLSQHTAALEASLARVKRLEGILPICMYCKKIRNQKEAWDQLERYISQHTDARFSHGICPECLPRFEAEANKSAMKP